MSASLGPGHDALLPHAPGGLAPGALLALLVHGGLILALTTAVDWRTRPPEVFSAELWSSVPQTAAPKVEAPAPAPVAPVARAPTPAVELKPTPAARLAQPDIAVERAKQLNAATAKAEAEAQKLKIEQAAREKEAREAKAEDDRLAKLREENLKRMMGQAGNAAGRSGTAAQDAAPSTDYGKRVGARIRRELVFTGSVPESAEAEVTVRAGPSGTIIGRQLSKSSGYKDWDEAVLRAIDKTSSLPRDVDGRVPAVLTLVFNRKE